MVFLLQGKWFRQPNQENFRKPVKFLFDLGGAKWEKVGRNGSKWHSEPKINP
jgi:hypothetical protein